MRILVVGAGVAGLSAAANLVRDGHQVTVVEIASELRTAGGPVDVMGDALDMMRAMGAYDQIKAAQIHMTAETEFVDDDGALLAKFPIAEISDSPDDIEIGRIELMPIMRGAATGADIRFATTVNALADDGGQVHVTLSDGTEHEYDLLLGADGVHSRVRALLFGPESDFVQYQGAYVGFGLYSDEPAEGPSQQHNVPGKMLGWINADGRQLVSMFFRSEQLDYDFRDLDAIRDILRRTFDYDRWRTRELVDALVAAPDLYFDGCFQTHMDTWCRGHAILIGDAAHCGSPLSGRGVSLAIKAGFFLAQALREHPNDLDAAYKRYEELHRPHVDAGQRSVAPHLDMMVPATAEAIDARNARQARMAEGRER